MGGGLVWRGAASAAVVVCVLVGAAPGCAEAPSMHSDVSYDDRFGEETTMDLYVPNDGKSRHPAVLFIHGGGWKLGDRRPFADGERLAASGFVTA